ncbi:MAG: M2 family metallopeptidase [Actinomycetota bacterium]
MRSRRATHGELPPTLPEAPHRLVASLEGRFKGLETDFHDAYWRSQIDVGPESERRRTELELELRRIKGDGDALASVEAALEDPLHDPLLERQLQVLRLSLLGNQMDDAQREEMVRLASSIEGDFSAHRPLLDGERVTDNDIEEVLRDSDDVDRRRRAWEASKEVGGVVASRIRELARVRNAFAHELGYGDYFQMALELQELDESWLFATLEGLERLTRGPYLGWKQDLDDRLRARFGDSELYPWHYADPFFQHAPPDGRVSLDGVLRDASAVDLARETFALWAIDLTEVMAQSDVFPRERKSQHAFCLDVDRTGSNVRLLANIVPGERWVEVMLHESGHAAYDVSIEHDVPYLLHRPAHTFVTEAIAILSGRLVRDPKWLVDVAGIPAQEVTPLEQSLARAGAAQSLVFARLALVVVHFERQLYADPEADLDAAWWELVERYQLVRRPPARSAPDWAAKIHVAAAPAYYQNYILGEVLASQLRAACEHECGALVGSREAGELLKERVFRHGSMKRWDALIEGATGRPLSPDDFASQLVA